MCPMPRIGMIKVYQNGKSEKKSLLHRLRHKKLYQL